MELISKRELSKRLQLEGTSLRAYLCRPEFAPYRHGHKIIDCFEVRELIKYLYDNRKKGRKPYNAFYRARA